MKGPHFFEKRKKEMARQEKAKQKAERKAQRKAGKGKDDPEEPGDADDELLLDQDSEGQEGQIAGQLATSEEAPISHGTETEAQHAPGPVRSEDSS